MQATVNDLQDQMIAVHAALEGKGQACLFKPRCFSGLPSEDINEWLRKFDQYAKFYAWSNAKKFGAMSLLLDGPAKARLNTQPSDTVNDFNALCNALKDRFGAQDLALIFQQELYSRKQRPNEPLASYTEEIIKKCQRLSITDNDMMNIYINGLVDDIKTHVILNQPDSFAKAENLARLREAVMNNNSLTSARSNVMQDQRIKELEGQVDLLVSLASKSKLAPNTPMPSVHAVSANYSVDQAVAMGNPHPITVNELADLRAMFWQQST